MPRSVLVGAADAPSWRHHDVAQLPMWLSYTAAAGHAHRAPSPRLFGQFVEDVPMDRYRGIGGGWGADLAMAMWVPLVGRLPCCSAFGAATAEPWLGKLRTMG